MYGIILEMEKHFHSWTNMVLYDLYNYVFVF